VEAVPPSRAALELGHPARAVKDAVVAFQAEFVGLTRRFAARTVELG
jgi:hypothetical protein